MIRITKNKETHHANRRAWLSLLAMLICCSLLAAAQTTIRTEDTGPVLSIRSTHLLGFEDAKNNCTGTLAIDNHFLQFQQKEETPTRVKIAAIRNLVLGEESKQVGGLPMTLGKAAAPFGSGRVVSLVAHKTYDTLTVEYVDDTGGIHGAIFELQKGQAEVAKRELMTLGAIVPPRQDRTTPQDGEVGHDKK